MDRERLSRAGIDAAGALARFLNNEEMYDGFLLKFSEDDTFSRLEKAVEGGAAEEIYRAAHTLKGVAANLGMTDLEKACGELAALGREGKTEGAAELFRRAAGCYRVAVAAIGEKA